MSALPPADAARLVKFLGMLGSHHGGERASAGLKAHQFVAERKLTWADLITPALPSPPPRPRATVYPAQAQTSQSARPHQQWARRCLASTLIAWKPHELKFLEQMAEQLRKPSEAQCDWLEGLVDRLARKAREASDVDY